MIKEVAGRAGTGGGTSRHLVSGGKSARRYDSRTRPVVAWGGVTGTLSLTDPCQPV